MDEGSKAILRQFLDSSAGKDLTEDVRISRPPIKGTGTGFEAYSLNAAEANGWESCWKHIMDLADKDLTPKEESPYKDL